MELPQLVKQAMMTSLNKDRVSVLFVCMGNICRSPLAEGVFRHLVAEANLNDRFEIDSAGTSSYHAGDPPDHRTTAVARKRGIELTGCSRAFVEEDLHRFDYVIAMDGENHAVIERTARKVTDMNARIHLLREFDPVARGDLNVPDPYFGGGDGFERVHDIVDRSCRELLAHVRQAKGL
ncbi:MAG TPA: low molecular weight protein-tyrosine-phosphatase [Longimicrobiales bacterium]|nr:low molecular weight protein-tyrosine-phosphatase [Longimicrobiales bacterium]